MARYPHPNDVVGLEQVVKALERAQQVTVDGPPFELCITDAAGGIIAALTVHGFDRVKVFSRAMATLGYAADIVGDRRVPCDVLYVRAAHVRDIFDDGGPNTDPAPLT